MEKKCWKCQEIKDVTHFYKDSYSKDGLQKACKDCQKKRNNEYALAHKDYFKQKNKEKYNPEENPERYQQYKDKFLEGRVKQSSSVRGRLKTLLSSAKGRALKKGLDYELSYDWLFEQYKKQEGKCLLTGIPLEFCVNADKSRRYQPFSPSLDRIDPSKGYTKENVRLVCTAINVAMNEWGEELYAKVCQAYIAKLSSDGYEESCKPGCRGCEKHW